MPARDNRLRAPDSQALNVIGPRVRVRRRALRLKQHSLAARIATVTGNRWAPSVLDITRIETGIRTCVDTEVLAIAVALGCDPGWLIAGDPGGSGGSGGPGGPSGPGGKDDADADGQSAAAAAPWQEGKD